MVFAGVDLNSEGIKSLAFEQFTAVNDAVRRIIPYSGNMQGDIYIGVNDENKLLVVRDKHGIVNIGWITVNKPAPLENDDSYMPVCFEFLFSPTYDITPLYQGRGKFNRPIDIELTEADMYELTKYAVIPATGCIYKSSVGLDPLARLGLHQSSGYCDNREFVGACTSSKPCKFYIDKDQKFYENIRITFAGSERSINVNKVVFAAGARMSLSAIRDYHVDHINNDPEDNRFANLQLVTAQVNNAFRGIRQLSII